MNDCAVRKKERNARTLWQESRSRFYIRSGNILLSHWTSFERVIGHRGTRPAVPIETRAAFPSIKKLLGSLCRHLLKCNHAGALGVPHSFRPSDYHVCRDRDSLQCYEESSERWEAYTLSLG